VNFSKTTLFASARINSVPDGETAQNRRFRNLNYRLFRMQLLSMLVIITRQHVCNSVRLDKPNGNAAEGRLEVYYNEAWGTVCDDGFTDVAAKVACNGLGYGYVVYTRLVSHIMYTDRKMRTQLRYEL